MASYSSQLSRAARAPGSYTQSTLEPLNSSLNFDTELGVGVAAARAALAGGMTEVRFEECTIYSEVVVTEAGVFELPPGWPDANAYPGSEFADADLPELGGAYVLQRRTHAYLYTTETGDAAGRHTLAAYAKPFAYAGRPVEFPVPAGVFAPVVKAMVSRRVRAAAEADAPLISAVSSMLGLYGAQVA